jgi:hypothetical protein
MRSFVSAHGLRATQARYTTRYRFFTVSGRQGTVHSRISRYQIQNSKFKNVSNYLSLQLLHLDGSDSVNVQIQLDYLRRQMSNCCKGMLLRVCIRRRRETVPGNRAHRAQMSQAKVVHDALQGCGFCSSSDTAGATIDDYHLRINC